ncbi:MAG TPA: matrixin family metalloprotease [Deltaproteobacteria bacterium]|nr:matrixin family metalloprotease [Deltaproteobacteria bacterium]
MMTILLVKTALAWEVQTTDAGEAYHWAEMPLPYLWVDEGAPDLPALEGAIDGSFAAWAEVSNARIEVRSEEGTAPPRIALDDIHTVFFEHDWPVGDEALAVATSWADASGNVVAYDIRVNASIPWSTTGAQTAFDLQAAITHEVGHVLGLEHSEAADATMYASHAMGETWRRELHADDREAIHFVYGDTEPLDGATGLGPGCSTTGAAPGWLLPIIPALFLLKRR